MPLLRIVTEPNQPDVTFNLSEEDAYRLDSFGEIYPCGDPSHGHPEDYHLDPESNGHCIEDLLIAIHKGLKPITATAEAQVTLSGMDLRLKRAHPEEFIEEYIKALSSSVARKATELVKVKREDTKTGDVNLTVSLEIVP